MGEEANVSPRRIRQYQQAWCVVFALSMGSCGATEVATAPVDQSAALTSCGPACSTDQATFEAAYDACVRDRAACAGRALPCEAYCAVKAGCTGTLRGWTLSGEAECAVACPVAGQQSCGETSWFGR